MRVLLLTPPMVQLNTPYPATAYLTGYLRKIGVDAVQADPAIELACRLFSAAGVERIMDAIADRGRRRGGARPESVRFFVEAFEDYRRTVDPVVRFLQGGDPSLAMRIAARGFVPEGPRFQSIPGLFESDGAEVDYLDWAFGRMGVQDRAKYVASLFIDDLADVIRDGVDSRFSLSRYGEKLAASQPSFRPLSEALSAPRSLVDVMLEEITGELLERHRPGLVALSVPFPGSMYGALRMGRMIRELSPKTRVALGGGYVNTELRELAEPELFDFVDYVTLDDGEKPLQCLVEHLEGRRAETGLLRTFVRRDGKVRFVSSSNEHDVPMKDAGTPTYDGLPLGKYFSILELLNPMHRLWSDARWNKVTLAHGCYWKKCSFCDVSLDYIGRYEAAATDLVLDRMEALIRETGQTGFHLVDEAAPPAALRALSQGILERGLTVSWWGNIRFEKSFDARLTTLMADAGCVAVSGGLEVASDRLLNLMNKGVSVEQVARVTRAFRDAGILVHAYLMYGFPTQTEQETIDSLERVRQLFEADCIQSAFWHRFSATVHSPVGKDPESFGIHVTEAPRPARLFARNDLDFDDPTGCDHDLLGRGLNKALYNYMHGIGIDEDVSGWFERAVPATTVPRALIRDALGAQLASERRGAASDELKATAFSRADS